MNASKVPRIAIAGTWGVPAKYGGFETTAEQLARSIDPTEVRLTIYGQKSAYSVDERRGDFAGHERIWLPFSANGAQSVLHDALQLLHAAFVGRHQAILLLGVSGAWVLPFIRGLRPGLRIVTNIDGLEWRRSKFGARTHKLLRWLERCAVRNSDIVVADNAGLVPIVRQVHGIEPSLIAYGGDHICVAPARTAKYLLSVARIEPENNPGPILDAAMAAGAALVFVGNWDGTTHGRLLKATYAGAKHINIHPPVYDQEKLGEIRAASSAYVHGHSVGGTNPSLTEAIFHSRRILAFDCPFNRATLEGEGAYWRTSEDLAELMCDESAGTISNEALAKLRHRYRWQTIADAYLQVLLPAARIDKRSER